MKKSLHIVFLNSCVLGDEFKCLHPYLHSGSYSEGIPAFLCKDIDASGMYLSIRLFGVGVQKNRKIQVQHSLVVAVVELASTESQAGFVG
jgi:hypothetical protein